MVDPAAPSSLELPSWDGALYAANTGHHRVHDAAFIDSTPLRAGDRVLDLGCGSGDLTATIAGFVPDGHVVGLDAQQSMIDQAVRRAQPNQSFVTGPIQRLDDLVTGPFDVILSRAVFQWLPWPDWPEVLATAARLVRPGGWIRIECGGAGNIAHARTVLDEISIAHGGPASPLTFPDAGAAMELLEAVGLDATGDGCFVRTVAQRRPFDEQGIVGWLRSQVLLAYGLGDEFRSAVEARLDDLRRADGSFDQTYVRLDLLARRPTEAPGT